MITDYRTVLVTGGTGSFGRAFVQYLADRLKVTGLGPKKLIIFSRDEFKQHQMQAEIPETDEGMIRYHLGDIRDIERLRIAFNGVDFVVHAAAMKHVPACERDPMEAIKTNVLGSENVIRAALECGVERVVALSTDKAVCPINFYGATKLQAEKLFQLAYNYGKTDFVVTRYGNVFGSSGSVVKVFLDCKAAGKPLPITDMSMTRFLISMNEAINLVRQALNGDWGKGAILVPKLEACTMKALADYIAPNLPKNIIGIRHGEKRHESLIAAHEAYDDFGSLYKVHRDGSLYGNSYESCDHVDNSIIETFF